MHLCLNCKEIFSYRKVCVELFIAPPISTAHLLRLASMRPQYTAIIRVICGHSIWERNCKTRIEVYRQTAEQSTVLEFASHHSGMEV